MDNYKAIVKYKDGTVLKFTVDNCEDFIEAWEKAFKVALKDHNVSEAEELISYVAVTWELE